MPDLENSLPKVFDVGLIEGGSFEDLLLDKSNRVPDHIRFENSLVEMSRQVSTLAMLKGRETQEPHGTVSEYTFSTKSRRFTLRHIEGNEGEQTSELRVHTTSENRARSSGYRFTIAFAEDGIVMADGEIQGSSASMYARDARLSDWVHRHPLLKQALLTAICGYFTKQVKRQLNEVLALRSQNEPY